MYLEVEQVVEMAMHAAKLAEDAVKKQRLDTAAQQGVGKRAYAATSLRRIFPEGSSAVVAGGVVERVERRRPTYVRAASAAASATWSC